MSQETLQLFTFLYPLQHMKRPASQNKRGGVLRMAFRVRKVFGTFEKGPPAGPYAILAGLDGFFRPCARHRVRPSYGDFLNTFAMKARAGPYGSYENTSYFFYVARKRVLWYGNVRTRNANSRRFSGRIHTWCFLAVNSNTILNWISEFLPYFFLEQ